MSNEFLGKSVLVTGAASGIGAAIAKKFSILGASVVLADRDYDNLIKIGEQCASPTFLIKADITNEDDVKNIIKQTIEKNKKLDVLVNNAGIFDFSDIEDISFEVHDRVMNINVRAVFQLTNLAVPYLIATKGNIINMSSIAALSAMPHGLSYAVSKAAINEFTRCIAFELAPKGVRVNSINPGIITTAIFKNIYTNEEDQQKFIEQENKLHPLGRVGKPEEVADLAAFLVSEKAGFITGTYVPIDGGRSAESR